MNQAFASPEIIFSSLDANKQLQQRVIQHFLNTFIYCEPEIIVCQLQVANVYSICIYNVYSICIYNVYSICIYNDFTD